MQIFYCEKVRQNFPVVTPIKELIANGGSSTGNKHFVELGLREEN